MLRILRVESMDKAQDEGEGTISIAMVNRKRNDGRLLPRIGFKMTFQTGDEDSLDGVKFEKTDIRDVAQFADKMSTKDRILNELRGGPLEQMALSNNLGIPVASIKARVWELEKMGKVVIAGGRIGLPSVGREN